MLEKLLERVRRNRGQMLSTRIAAPEPEAAPPSPALAEQPEPEAAEVVYESEELVPLEPAPVEAAPESIEPAPVEAAPVPAKAAPALAEAEPEYEEEELVPLEPEPVEAAPVPEPAPAAPATPLPASEPEVRSYRTEVAASGPVAVVEGAREKQWTIEAVLNRAWKLGSPGRA